MRGWWPCPFRGRHFARIAPNQSVCIYIYIFNFFVFLLAETMRGNPRQHESLQSIAGRRMQTKALPSGICIIAGFVRARRRSTRATCSRGPTSRPVRSSTATRPSRSTTSAVKGRMELSDGGHKINNQQAQNLAEVMDDVLGSDFA